MVLMLMVLLAGLVRDAAAQRFVSMHVDSTYCVGDSIVLTVGHSSDNDIVVENAPTAISHPQCTFLPDGVVCDSALGTCTYRSPLTFTAFDGLTTITSAQEIDFVRLNIEHSWIADLLIAIECPNGQFASLMYSSTLTVLEHCGDPKFDSLVGWEMSVLNMGASTALGFQENRNCSETNPCDTSDEDNRPGVGWNYCWSENNGHGYAPGDGLIYRHGNSFYDEDRHRYVVDSTHIAADTHFFRPQESFDSLIGCPLNGTWNIVVQDQWAKDNGYVFDWELAFVDSMLVPAHIVDVEWRAGSGEWRAVDDTTLLLLSTDRDSTVEYGLRVVLSSGDTVDTVFSIHWLEPFVESVTDTLCQGDTARWTSLYFTSDTLHLIRETTHYGCDSIVDLHYTFMPTYHIHDTIPYCANEQFLYDGVDYGGPATIVVPYLSQYGCDSIHTVHLIVIDSAFHLQLQVSDNGELWSADTVLHGCQPMTVWLRDTTLFEQWRQWTFGDGDTLQQEVTAYQQSQPFTHSYDSIGSYTLTLTAVSIHGCVDSVVFRGDAVRVHPSPKAQFIWTPELIVMHDAWTQFENRSTPMDSLRFLWHIADGNDGVDTTSEVSPRYWWPMVYGDFEVLLDAMWTHHIGDSLTLVCADTATHTVVIVSEYLQFPTLVTPNGDGINDRWVIVNMLECGLYGMNELWIYNSWGALVHHVKNISRDEDFWDPAGFPDGTYYYRFTAHSPLTASSSAMVSSRCCADAATWRFRRR